MYTKKQLEKMRDNLVEWIQADIADDIINSTFQRQEYAPFVVAAFLRKVERENIPSSVLWDINQEILALEESIGIYKPSLMERLKAMFSGTAR